MNEHLTVTVPARFLASPDFMKQLKASWGDEKKMQAVVQLASKRLSSMPFKDQSAWTGFMVMLKAKGAYLVADIYVPDEPKEENEKGLGN